MNSDEYNSPNTSYEDKMSFLDSILGKGIEKLLLEARSRGYLEPPYGRPPLPTPLITEEDFLTQSGLNEISEENLNNAEFDDEPPFEFKYGFNPIRQLANFILWSHPSTIQARLEARIKARERLQSRVLNANDRLLVAEQLKSVVSLLSSGIMWGPYTSPTSSKSVVCVCQPIKAGIVNIDVSDDESFSNIILSLQATADVKMPEVGDDAVAPVKVNIDKLESGTNYFIRCCLQDISSDGSNQKKFLGAKGGKYQVSKFSTLPDEEETEEDFPPIQIVALGHCGGAESSNFYDLQSLISPHLVNVSNGGSNTDGDEKNDVETETIEAGSISSLKSNSKPCLIGCVLGEIFDIQTPSEVENEAISADYWSQFWNIYRRCASEDGGGIPRGINGNPLFNASSVIVGWNDTREGADSDLRAEERIYKQYEHDLKKYNKKYAVKAKKGSAAAEAAAKAAPPPLPPALTRPQLTPSLQSFLQGFAVNINDSKATQNVYRTFYASPNVQIFVLDARKGYLGKVQAKWLREELIHSNATWKVVLSSVSLGTQYNSIIPRTATPGGRLRNKSFVSDKDSPTEDGEEGAEERTRFQIPEPSEMDETDDQGRPKSSLQYVVAYHQLKAALGKKSEENKGDVEIDEDSSLASTDLISPNEGGGGATTIVNIYFIQKFLIIF
jgi:hypothetical protein